MDIDEIPLVIKGNKVGVIERVIIKPSTDPDKPWFKIMFDGTLIKDLNDVEKLIKLLQKEGIHLGKP